MRKMTRRASRAKQVSKDEPDASRTSARLNIATDNRNDQEAEQQLHRESEEVLTQSAQRPAAEKRSKESASVARLQALKARSGDLRSQNSVGTRVRASPRPGSTGRRYDVREIFRDQRNGKKLDFNDEPSQWASSRDEADEPYQDEPDQLEPVVEVEVPQTLTAQLRASKKSALQTKKSTPNVTPQKKVRGRGRGRPRGGGRPRKETTPESSAVPSPLATRATERQKRQREASPKSGARKRIKANTISRAEIETQEPLEDVSTRSRNAQETTSKQNEPPKINEEPMSDNPEIVETEGETDVEYNTAPSADQEVELGDNLSQDRAPSPRATRSSQRQGQQKSKQQSRKQSSKRKGHSLGQKPSARLSLVAEEISEIIPNPATPIEQIDNEDDEYEEESVAQDDSDEDGAVNTERRTETQADQQTLETATADLDEANQSKAMDVYEIQVSDEGAPIEGSKKTKSKSVDPKTKKRKTNVPDQHDGQQSTSQNTQGSSHAGELFLPQEEIDADVDDRDHEFIDLEDTLHDVPISAGRSSFEKVGNRIMNELLDAARDYRETTVDTGFLRDDFTPTASRFRKCSKSLRALYHCIVEFIDELDQDLTLEDGRLPATTWDSLVTLDDRVRDLSQVLESKSRSAATVFGLFSMIPLVATAFKLQLAVQSQSSSTDDAVQTTRLLHNLCWTYELLHWKIRDIKDKTAGPPVLKTAFAFRKHIVELSRHLKKKVERIRQAEKDRKNRKDEEERQRIIAERNKLKANVDTFDIKRNRLLALWNRRQECEPNIHLRITKFGSAQISDYWKGHYNSKTGHVRPSAWFDWNELAFTTEEIKCLERAIKSHHRLGPYKMWSTIFEEKCGHGATLKSRTVDQLLNVAKFLKQYYLEVEGFVDDYWNHIPDLDLCDLLPVRRADTTTTP